MHPSITRVARRFLASYQNEVGSLPLAAVVSHKVGGQFGRTLRYIRTYQGWRQFRYRGTVQGRENGQIMDTRINEGTLKEAYEQGTLGLMLEGVKKGGLVQYMYQLDALKPGSIVREPGFTDLVKQPSGKWTGGQTADQPDTGVAYESHLMSGVLSDDRAKWVK